MQVPVFTIGHSNRKAEVFTRLLKDRQIDYLVDVRSKPYSRFNPQFNKHRLEKELADNNIKYVFMGDLLGGRPEDASCYDNGKIDYVKVAEKDFFKEGIHRLKKAYTQNLRLAIMCSEGKPQECHRTHLIARSLCREGLTVVHIDEKGNDKPHELLSGELNLLF